MRKRSAAVAALACTVGLAFVPPSSTGSPGLPARSTAPEVGTKTSLSDAAPPLALGAAAVAATAAYRRRQKSVARADPESMQRAPLLSGLEATIQGKLEERMQRQQSMTSEMQRNHDTFKKMLEEELSSHMRMKDQLKSRICALQSIYDDANDKLEFAQTVSQQSQDNCHELKEEVTALERNLREVEKKNSAKISQLEGEAKEKEVKLDQLTMATSRLHQSMRELEETRQVERREAAAKAQDLRNVLQTKQTALQTALHLHDEVQAELLKCKDQIVALTRKVQAAENLLLAQNNKNQELSMRLQLAQADSQRLSTEQTRLQQEKRAALMREQRIQANFSRTEDRHQALQQIIPLMEADEKNLKDRIAMLEDQAQNEKVLSYRLQECEDDNTRLAAEVQQMQAYFHQKEREQAELTKHLAAFQERPQDPAHPQASGAKAVESAQAAEAQTAALETEIQEARSAEAQAQQEEAAAKQLVEEAKAAQLRAVQQAQSCTGEEAAKLLAEASVAKERVRQALQSQAKAAQDADAARQTVAKLQGKAAQLRQEQQARAA